MRGKWLRLSVSNIQPRARYDCAHVLGTSENAYKTQLAFSWPSLKHGGETRLNETGFVGRTAAACQEAQG